LCRGGSTPACRRRSADESVCFLPPTFLAPFLPALALGVAGGFACLAALGGATYNATSTGNAQTRAHRGSRTRTASTTHLCPNLKTVRVQLDLTASRWQPLLKT
jgi:hypothetical protein